MKAKNLNKVANAWNWIWKWWWVVIILSLVIWQIWEYIVAVKVIKSVTPVEKIVVPVAVADLPKELEQIKEDEILIVKKSKDEQVKILLLPDSAMQHWADSLFNAPAAYGER